MTRFFQLLAVAVFVALLLALAGCGPKRIDPPLFFESSARAANLAATLRAREVGGTCHVVAPTGSMEPLLTGGDFIAVEPRPYASLTVGQVITYRADWQPSGAPPVCHRLVQLDGAGWILSGDANARSEPQWRVTERNYLGVVIAIYRAAK